MHEQFFNFLGLREDPFHVSPDPRFYYCTPAHESALTELLLGIETRKGFLVLTGEAGTGKTSLMNRILDWLHRQGRSTAFLFHTHLEPIGLLRSILSDFRVPCQSKSKSELVNALHTWLLQRYAAGDLPVLILDEAQAVPLHTLDELRLLLNLETPQGKLLQVILSGQPELDQKLRLPELRQLRQRIMFHSRLPALTEKETAAYISSRLATAGCSDSALFPDETVRDIYTFSYGIPRVINLLCEHALISAYAEQQRSVSSGMIQRIANDFDLCVNPLEVSNSELQPHYLRLAPFSVIEEPAPPSMVIGPAAKEQPAPAAPPAAPVKSPKYWRRHRSRSVVAVFSHQLTSSSQRVWHAFTHAFANYVSYICLALFPSIKRTGLASGARQHFSSTCWAQTDFDLYKDQAIAKEAPAPLAPPAPVECPKYWRRRRSRWAVAAFGYHSTFQRIWHAFSHVFVCYVPSVSRSFVYDCRLFFRALIVSMPVLEFSSSPDDVGERLPSRRNVFAPIVNWLRQPFTPGNFSRNRSAAHRK
ncbi:MAG: AAA family ATPase [Candidatus Acidiferrum sp.]